MALIPTKNVRRKDDGHVCEINTDDFNPELHEDLDAIQEAEEIGEQVDITTLGQARAIELLDTLQTLEELAVFGEQEKANTRHPGGRVSVMRAVSQARERLS